MAPNEPHGKLKQNKNKKSSVKYQDKKILCFEADSSVLIATEDVSQCPSDGVTGGL